MPSPRPSTWVRVGAVGVVVLAAMACDVATPGGSALDAPADDAAEPAGGDGQHRHFGVIRGAIAGGTAVGRTHRGAIAAVVGPAAAGRAERDRIRTSAWLAGQLLLAVQVRGRWGLAAQDEPAADAHRCECRAALRPASCNALHDLVGWLCRCGHR